MARKGKFEEWLTDEGLLKIEAWARDGLTDAQICHNMGIAVSTFCEWKNRFPELSEALKKGKEVVDIMVENALLKRALGYEYTERIVEAKKVPILDDEGKVTGHREEQHEKRITKHIMPDTVAQIFWLKNRRPDKWRDKPIADNSVIEDLSILSELLK